MSELQSVHPRPHKEVASLSGRWISGITTAMAGILSFAPFIALYLHH